jgi:hypothetical protein
MAKITPKKEAMALECYEDRIERIHGRHSAAPSNMYTRKQEQAPRCLSLAAWKCNIGKKKIPLAISPDAALKANKDNSGQKIVPVVCV